MGGGGGGAILQNLHACRQELISYDSNFCRFCGEVQKAPREESPEMHGAALLLLFKGVLSSFWCRSHMWLRVMSWVCRFSQALVEPESLEA